MSKKKISVVMAVYNGEKYIAEQLQSIYDQTRKPDEVIIRDDCSTDGTYNEIASFINENQLSDSWKLFKNVNNLGWKKNFYTASQDCTGDIIFFSDQDDIWHKNKIETMSAIMEEKTADCVYSECYFIDSDGNPISKRNNKTFSGKLWKQNFSKNFNSKKTLGCRMCVSRKVINEFIELRYPKLGYDSQCGRIALLYDGIWVLESSLIDHRIHDNNSSKISSKGEQGQSTLEKRLEDIIYSYNWIRRILPSITSDEKTKVLRYTLKMQRNRYLYLTGNNKNWFDLIKYREYYSGAGMLIGDFAYKHKINRVMGFVADHL